MVTQIDRIETDVAPQEFAVFDIGANVRFTVTDTTARVYRKVCEMACFTGFLTGREVAGKMRTGGGAGSSLPAHPPDCAPCRNKAGEGLA